MNHPSAQQYDSMQKPNCGVALGWNWEGVANDAEIINVKVTNKNHNIRLIRGPYVVFEVEYLWNAGSRRIQSTPI